MPHPTRKAIARFAVTAVLIVVVVYPLSYAPMVRFGRVLPIFGPVKWLIDETPLRSPLLIWARLWGVESQIEWDSAYRRW